jgi:hypothetical protein
MISEDEWNSVVLEGELLDNGMISFANILENGEAEAIRSYIISLANAED